MPRKVSIITRTKDRPVLLARAIESVLAQTVSDWQHIIVNDGGDPATLDKMLEDYAGRYEGRLTVIDNPESLGMQAASNKALDLAEGEYVGVHDDDDAWHPDFLKECTAFLDNQATDSNYQGVVSHVVRVWEDIDADGNVVEHSRDEYLPLNQISLFRVGFENPFPPIAFLYRRSVHDTIGRFDQQFDVAGDMDFNIRFLLRYEIGVIPRKLAYYHWRRSSALGQLHNSVTAQAQDHGRRLNEWLNHYLRADAEKRPENLGLALNLAHYIVGTKGKAEEAAERIAQAQTRLAAVQDLLQAVAADTPKSISRLGDLKEHLTSVSDGLFGDLQPRLNDLKTHLSEITEALNASGALDVDRFTDFKTHLTAISQSLEASGALDAGRFTDFKEHLTSISGGLFEDLQPRVDDLKEHLSAITQALEVSDVSDTDRLTDFKQHLTSISNGLFEDLQPRVDDLKIHLSAITQALEVNEASDTDRLTDFKQHLTSISGGLFGDIKPQIEALRLQLAGMSEALFSDFAPQQKEMAAQLLALRGEISDLRKVNEEARKGLRLGPLRITWRRRKQS